MKSLYEESMENFRRMTTAELQIALAQSVILQQTILMRGMDAHEDKYAVLDLASVAQSYNTELQIRRVLYSRLNTPLSMV